MTKPFLPRRCRSARGGGAGGAKPFWGHPCRVTPCCSCPRETPGKCQGLAGHGAGWPERGTELRWEVFLHEAKHSGRLLSAPSSVKWTRGCLLQRPGSFPALAILSNFLNFHWTRLWWVFFFPFPALWHLRAVAACSYTAPAPRLQRLRLGAEQKMNQKSFPFPSFLNLQQHRYVRGRARNISEEPKGPFGG